MLSRPRDCSRLFVGLSLLLVAGTVAAQTASPQPDTREILREIDALRKDIRDVKDILQHQQITLPQGASRSTALPEALPPKEITLPFVPSQSLGSGDTKYVVVEFADLQCPYCAHFDKTSFQAFRTLHVNTGELRFMSLDFPLESHPDAVQMSLASICAGEQGKYWEMRSALMEAKSLSEKDLLDKQAVNLGLDSRRFSECVASDRRLAALKDQAAKAHELGVAGTPTFLVGVVEQGRIRGQLLVGSSDADQFSKRVEAVLTQYKEGKDAAISSLDRPK
jgi:protein-disulfide isomerase